MKRDMELIRLILVQHETEEASPELEAYSLDDVIYNYWVMENGGLIEAKFMKDGSGKLCAVTGQIRLTWAGHDFLDATKDSKIWKMALEHIIKPGVSWTFQTLVEYLKSDIARRFPGADSSGQ